MSPLLHASPSPDADPSTDALTGEVRIPIQLWTLDRPQGATALVLSAREVDELYEQLGTLLAARRPPAIAGVPQ